MNGLVYPWPWLRDSDRGPLDIRIPWLERIRTAACQRQPVVLLVPEAAGDLEFWGQWLWSALDAERLLDVFSGPPTAADIENYFCLEPPFGAPRGSRAWAESLLRKYRDREQQVTPDLVVAIASSPSDWLLLETWIEAQRSTSVPLLSPIVLARDPPIGNAFSLVVRFGAPEIIGNLHSVQVFPDANVELWTSHYLALTVVWECGGLPHVADELWTFLRDELPALDRTHFDELLRNKLNTFARQQPASSIATDITPRLRAWCKSPPERYADEELWECWHQGILTVVHDGFDLTPMVGRALFARLPAGELRQALHRRRLVNAPLARWLAAWGATIEESLRIVVMGLGVSSFKEFLQQSAARSPQTHPSRYDELMWSVRDGDGAVEAAEFIDLIGYVSSQKSFKGVGPLLHDCRNARNEVIHERTCSASAVCRITRAISWLSKQNAI